MYWHQKYPYIEINKFVTRMALDSGKMKIGYFEILIIINTTRLFGHNSNIELLIQRNKNVQILVLSLAA